MYGSFFLGSKFNIAKLSQVWIEIPKKLKMTRGTGTPEGMGHGPSGPRSTTGFVHPPIFSEERYKVSERRAPSSTLHHSSPLPSRGGLSNAHQVAQSPVARLFLLWSQPQGPPHHHKPQEPRAHSQTPRAQGLLLLGAGLGLVREAGCARTGSDSVFHRLDSFSCVLFVFVVFCLHFDLKKILNSILPIVFTVLGGALTLCSEVSASLASPPRVPRTLPPSEGSSLGPDSYIHYAHRLLCHSGDLREPPPQPSHTIKHNVGTKEHRLGTRPTEV